MWSSTSASGAVPSLPAELELLAGSDTYGCFLLDADGNLSWANDLCHRWLGGGSELPIEGRALTSWLDLAEQRSLIDTALQSRDRMACELLLNTDSAPVCAIVGELIGIQTDAGNSCMAGIFREPDSGQRSIAGMERSVRLEALGSLTSGVAHDFNNLLTILVGNLSLLAEEMRDEERHFAKLKSARDAARRGSDLIRQLLNFARQEPVASEPIDPARVIAKIAPLIERALGKRIRLELDLAQGLDPVQGNSAQLESVIVNLAVNARDAIEAKGCVRISVAAQQYEGRNFIELEVSDDGAGIPADIAEQVFEPFFTTKADGKGSGLGLAMVKAYADEFDGDVGLITGVNQGTTISLRFPCVAGRAEDSAAMTMPIAALPGGDETVLLLTADEGLSRMVEQTLAVLGYSCHVASAIDAVGEVLASTQPDLLISDGFDPELLGQRPPSGRVLMLALMGENESAGRHAVLHKPFSLPDFAVAVRAALDSEATQ